MSKRMWLLIVVLVAIMAGTIAFDVFKKHMIAKVLANFKAPPQTIATVQVKQATWHPTIQAVGTLKAIQGVNVNSEVPGQVDQINFKSGDYVKKGQSLIHLDDSIDKANYQNNLASLSLAQTKFKRQSKLLKTGATSTQAFDEARATLGETTATVKADLVRIDKKDIKAPFSGKIGIRQVNIGQYVQPGDALVSLQAMNPLYVDFYLPEQDLKNLHVGQTAIISITAFPKKKFDAKITAIDSIVDQSTRNFKVRASVPNPNGMLYPGVFANVSINLPAKQNILVIPQNAISYTLYGDTVYMVKSAGKDKKTGKPALKAVRQAIKLGDARGTQVEVISGLKVGDEIVSAGQVKLQNNSAVVINNSMALDEGGL